MNGQGEIIVIWKPVSMKIQFFNICQTIKILRLSAYNDILSISFWSRNKKYPLQIWNSELKTMKFSLFLKTKKGHWWHQNVKWNFPDPERFSKPLRSFPPQQCIHAWSLTGPLSKPVEAYRYPIDLIKE
jgi:hypothetical protein